MPGQGSAPIGIILGGGPRRRAPKKPAINIKGAPIPGQMGRLAGVVSRVSWPVAAGSMAWMAGEFGSKWLGDWHAAKLDAQMRLEYEQARARLRAKMAAEDTELEKAIHRKRGQRGQAVVIEDGKVVDIDWAEWNRQRIPGAPPPWLLPKPGAAGATPPRPPVPPGPPPGRTVITPGGVVVQQPAVPTPATTKEKVIARANQVLSWIERHPLIATAAAALIAQAAQPGGRKPPAAPAELPVDEGLTAFQPMELFSGTVGGVPVGAPALGAGEQLSEFEDVDLEEGECERIDPPRSPGECRQGWFSETPDSLHLREWSRRPCR
jgi:hypothetical protein